MSWLKHFPMLASAWAFLTDSEADEPYGRYPNGNGMSVRDARELGLLPPKKEVIMATSNHPTRTEYVSFKDFLCQNGIEPNDERVPLLKAAWNQSLDSACECFDEIEGTTFDLETELRAE